MNSAVRRIGSGTGMVVILWFHGFVRSPLSLG